MQHLPWNVLTQAPIQNIPSADTSDQKKAARPYPYWNVVSAAMLACRSPSSRNAWLPTSTSVCMASENMAELPVFIHMLNFITVISTLPTNAACERARGRIG